MHRTSNPIVRTSRNHSGDLVIVYRPVAVLVVAVVGAVTCLGYAGVHAARGQWLMESVGWPLVATLVFAGGGAALGRWWRIDFDRATQHVRWTYRGIAGSRSGSLPFDRIVGVVTRARRAGARGNRRRPPLELVLLLPDGDSFPLTHHAAVGRSARARLKLTAAVIREELGLPQPDEERGLIDAVISADSLILAAREVHDRTGLPLPTARDIARSARAPRP